METVAGLPAAAKLSGGTTKRVFKDALRPWIPDHILDRRKMGFSVPVAEWFRGSLRHLPAEVLLDPRSLSRGLFREEGVRRLIEEHASGARDNAGRIWALLQLELWLRTYVDQSTPTQPMLGVS
jgi:asparagine synthase (glutamine-hydrolysing)